MTSTELFSVADMTFTNCSTTLKAKNHDYAKNDADALRNFKAVEFFNLTDISVGVCVRLCDKFMRICNLLNSKAAVKDETIEDTIDDMINYLVILKSTIIEKNTPPKVEGVTY